MESKSLIGIEQPIILETPYVMITVKQGEMISSYLDKTIGLSIDMPTKMFTYPATNGQTLSGLYIFNPKQNATERSLILTHRYLQKGSLGTMLHSFYQVSGLNIIVSQAIYLNMSKNEQLRRTVRVTTKMMTVEYFEYTMRTNIESMFNEDTTEIYIDNSVNSAKRQFYTLEQAKANNLTDLKYESYIGLNGYASIYGTAFKTQNNTFFGFANSNSILVNALKTNLYEVMLMRNTNYYDDKGITDPLRDQNIETFDQIMFIASDTKDFYDIHTAASAVSFGFKESFIFNISDKMFL